MTHDEAVSKAEEKVYVYMTEGSIIRDCDDRGFKYRTKKDGHFASGERSRCEAFLIADYTNEMEAKA